jgi:hypothetical protein
VNAGVDQGEPNDDPQDIALSKHPPKSDEDEGETGRQNDI